MPCARFPHDVTLGQTSQHDLSPLRTQADPGCVYTTLGGEAARRSPSYGLEWVAQPRASFQSHDTRATKKPAPWGPPNGHFSPRTQDGTEHKRRRCGRGGLRVHGRQVTKCADCCKCHIVSSDLETSQEDLEDSLQAAPEIYERGRMHFCLLTCHPPAERAHRARPMSYSSPWNSRTGRPPSLCLVGPPRTQMQAALKAAVKTVPPGSHTHTYNLHDTTRTTQAQHLRSWHHTGGWAGAANDRTPRRCHTHSLARAACPRPGGRILSILKQHPHTLGASYPPPAGGA